MKIHSKTILGLALLFLGVFLISANAYGLTVYMGGNGGGGGGSTTGYLTVNAFLSAPELATSPVNASVSVTTVTGTSLGTYNTPFTLTESTTNGSVQLVLTAFYSAYPSQTQSVTISAGQTAIVNFTFTKASTALPPTVNTMSKLASAPYLEYIGIASLILGAIVIFLKPHP